MEYWPGFFLPFFRVYVRILRIAHRVEELVLYIIISGWPFSKGRIF